MILDELKSGELFEIIGVYINDSTMLNEFLFFELQTYKTFPSQGKFAIKFFNSASEIEEVVVLSEGHLFLLSKETIIHHIEK